MRRMISATVACLFFMSDLAAGSLPSADPIIGKWQHVKLVHVADGKVVRVQEVPGSGTLEYRADGTWQMTSPGNNNSGTYRVLDNGELEVTTLVSDKPSQVGWQSRKHVHVEGTSLTMITHYDEKDMQAFPVRTDGTRPKTMTVTTSFVRVRD